MSLADDKLKAIKEQLKQGVAPPRETVRSFLHWFQAERRGYYVVHTIRQTLKKYGVATTPDFESQYIDGEVVFVQAPPDKELQADLGQASDDPTYRLGRLESANRAPLTVKPDTTLSQTVTLMLSHDYSQLPVMTGPRDVKGVVSWKSIGSRLSLKRPCSKAQDCMEPAEITSIETSLFAAIHTVAEHDYVLAQASDKTICGIVTAADFNDQFRRLAEPFLLVGEIENGVRRLLHGKFTSKELEEAKNPGDDGRQIGAVSDLSFGEYIKLIESEPRWQKLNIAIDRVEFLSKLNDIRQVRNDVMHFDPDGLKPADFAALRAFAKFLKTLRDVGAV
jgi:CBS domain-containing protein